MLEVIMQKNKIDRKHRLNLLSFYILLLLETGLSFAQDQKSIMDGVSQGFGANERIDVQTTICSDSLAYSQDGHKIVYQGNVLIIQTKNANIQCAGYRVPNENNDWPVYQFFNLIGDYTINQQQSLDYAKSICKKQNGCYFFSGQILTILFDDRNKRIKDMLLTTTSPHITKFYSVPFSKKVQRKEESSHEQTTYAEGRRMDFNFMNSILSIEDHACIYRDGNHFSGEKVLYDTKNRLITVPNTGHRATLIVNNFNNK